MRTLVLIAVTWYGYYFFRFLTGIKISTVVREILAVFTHGVVDKSEKFRSETQQTFKRLTLDEKRKSKKYQYYCFINDILATFGLAERGVTVEGFTIGLFSICFCVGLVVGVLLQNVFICAFIATFGFVVVVAVIYLMSRVGVRKRKQYLLDAMDIICAVMSDGVLLAVKTNLTQIDVSVRPYFTRFVNNIELLNISVPHAIDILNNDIGGLYDEFCDSLIIFEESRALGMETLFNFYISENAKTMERDRKLKRMSDALNQDFLLTTAIIAIFGVFTATTSETGMALWTSALGVFAMVGVVVYWAIVFIQIQYMLSKPYIFHEEGTE